MADGNGAAAPAAGDAGAAATGADAGAGAAAGGTAGGGTGAGTAAVIAAQPEAPWYGDLDADSLGWLQNKQYFGPDIAKADVRKSFPEFVKAARGLERLVGDPTSRVIIPKDINDKEGWDALYSKLGRPADAKGYDLKAGEGGDQKITDSFAEIAHKAGLSTQQAQSVMQEFVGLAQTISSANKAAAEQTFLNNAQADMDALKAEWGGNTDAKFAAAQRAKVAYGLDEAWLNKFERTFGTKALIKHLSGIGANVSEDAGAGHGENGFQAMTKEAARAKMNDLKADKAWQARYFAGGHEEVAEWNRLEKILAGIR